MESKMEVVSLEKGVEKLIFYRSANDQKKRLPKEHFSIHDHRKTGSWVIFDTLGYPEVVRGMYQGKQYFEAEFDEFGSFSKVKGFPLNLRCTVDSIKAGEAVIFSGIPVDIPGWIFSLEMCFGTETDWRSPICEIYEFDFSILLKTTFSEPDRAFILATVTYINKTSKEKKKFELVFRFNVWPNYLKS